MPSSLIRGKYVICEVTGRSAAQVIADGAVFQRDGTIVDLGPYEELAAKYQPDEVLGSGEHVVMPGFVNSHHQCRWGDARWGVQRDHARARCAAGLPARRPFSTGGLVVR